MAYYNTIKKLDTNFPLTKEQVSDMYLVQLMDVKQIAKLADCSRQRLTRYMNTWGIPIRTSMEGATLKRKQLGAERGPNWKGGSWLNRKTNTWFSFAPYHPKTRHNGCVETHRLVAEARIGRYLTEDECVHHLDGNHTNNDPLNLCVMSRSNHLTLHRLLGDVGINLITSGQLELVIKHIQDPDKVKLISLVYSDKLSKIGELE